MESIRNWANFEISETRNKSFYPTPSSEKKNTNIYSIWYRVVACPCVFHDSIMRLPWKTQNGRKTVALICSINSKRTHTHPYLFELNSFIPFSFGQKNCDLGQRIFLQDTFGKHTKKNSVIWKWLCDQIQSGCGQNFNQKRSHFDGIFYSVQRVEFAFTIRKKYICLFFFAFNYDDNHSYHQMQLFALLIFNFTLAGSLCIYVHT